MAPWEKTSVASPSGRDRPGPGSSVANGGPAHAAPTTSAKATAQPARPVGSPPAHRSPTSSPSSHDQRRRGYSLGAARQRRRLATATESSDPFIQAAGDKVAGREQPPMNAVPSRRAFPDHRGPALPSLAFLVVMASRALLLRAGAGSREASWRSTSSTWSAASWWPTPMASGWRRVAWRLAVHEDPHHPPLAALFHRRGHRGTVAASYEAFTNPGGFWNWGKIGEGFAVGLFMIPIFSQGFRPTARRRTGRGLAGPSCPS